ncbi:MAG: hypothetical protein ACK4FF_11700 [Limnobacter sp.]|uniref:hypothetical protein n=1 Tax=Limnobacter sp. TaxID=2003368 RepID=UPI00391A3323
MKLAELLLVLGLVTSPALVHAHGLAEPKYGGIVQEVKEVQYELTHKNGIVTIYVSDHDGKKTPTAGMSGTLIVMNNAEKVEIPLQPGKDNDLIAQGPATVKSGSKIGAILKGPKGNAQVRFTIK